MVLKVTVALLAVGNHTEADLVCRRVAIPPRAYPRDDQHITDTSDWSLHFRAETM